MATCIGLWIFTRVLIPDVMLTFFIALSHVGFSPCSGPGGERTPSIWARSFLCLSRPRPDAQKPYRCRLSDRSGRRVFVFHRAIVFRPTWQKLRPISGTVLVLSLRLPGMSSRRSAIHLISPGRSRAWPATITVFFGSTSSMSNCYDFLICDIRATTTPCRASGSGSFIWCGYFPGASICLPSAGFRSSLLTGPEGSAVGLVLDRVCAGFFHFFHHARVLLDALLSGICIAAGFGNGAEGTVGFAEARTP